MTSDGCGASFETMSFASWGPLGATPPVPKGLRRYCFRNKSFERLLALEDVRGCIIR
jgi:hypothetical protein